jgi:hypothetical protein
MTELMAAIQVVTLKDAGQPALTHLHTNIYLLLQVREWA